MGADADNLLYGPLVNARTLLAGSATFQSLVEAEDAAEAAERIYIPVLEPPETVDPETNWLSQVRPFAVIDQGDDRQMVAADTDTYDDGGTVLVHLEADVPEAYQGETTAQHAAAARWFYKLVGDVWSEILDLGNQGGYLAVDHVRLLSGPARPDLADRAEEGDHFQVGFEIRWRGAA